MIQPLLDGVLGELKKCDTRSDLTISLEQPFPCELVRAAVALQRMHDRVGAASGNIASCTRHGDFHLCETNDLDTQGCRSVRIHSETGTLLLLEQPDEFIYIVASGVAGQNGNIKSVALSRQKGDRSGAFAVSNPDPQQKDTVSLTKRLTHLPRSAGPVHHTRTIRLLTSQTLLLKFVQLL